MSFLRIAGALVVATLAAAAQAQGTLPGLSRDQVRAELARARADGDLQAPGELGQTLREAFPGRYAAAPAPAGLTRSEVAAQLQEAQRNGDVAVGDTGLTRYDIAPKDFPSHAMAPAKTRDEVRAELADATREGDVVQSGELGLTAREQFPQRGTLVAGSTTPHPGQTLSSLFSHLHVH